MERKILNFITDNKMFQKEDKVLVGVSGGADSVCLLFVLRKLQEPLGISLEAVHVNHGLRGEEADNDERYVHSICDEWGIPCVTKHIDVKTAAAENRQSTEEAARILRYEAFDEIAGLHNCNKIAVAHHSDDQAETILFQIFRGSGLKGLAGMEPVRGNIVRPLLCVSRNQIEKYLADNSVNYCTDSTNLTTDYSRNRLRNQLIPYIQDNINAQAVTHLCELAEDTRRANAYIQKKSNEIFQKYRISDNRENNISNNREENVGNSIEKNPTLSTHINSQENVNTTNKTVKINTAIINEDKILVDYVIRYCISQVSDTLKDITRRHVDNIYQLLACEGYKMISLPYNVTVTKCYEELIFEKKCLQSADNMHNIGENTDASKTAAEDFTEIIIKKDDIINSGNGIFFVVNGQKIHFEIYDRKNLEIIDKKAYTKYLDCDKIKNTFALRFRKTGDYLVVNESGGKKKIKDYFIDMKIPRNIRDSRLLLVEDSHVIWAIGYRISEDVKITDDTTRVLQIEISMI